MTHKARDANWLIGYFGAAINYTSNFRNEILFRFFLEKEGVFIQARTLDGRMTVSRVTSFVEIVSAESNVLIQSIDVLVSEIRKF